MFTISNLLKNIFSPNGSKAYGNTNNWDSKNRSKKKKRGGGTLRRLSQSSRNNHQARYKNNFHQSLTRQILAYHGTPRKENVKSILNDGWMVGGGNNFGDGIYLAKDLNTAKSYAGSSGVYIKCLVALGKSCNWNSIVRKHYSDWCKQKGVQQDNSAITAFLIKRGINTLQNGNIVVVLSPQYKNASAWKCKNHRIRILSVHRAVDDQRIRV